MLSMAQQGNMAQEFPTGSALFLAIQDMLESSLHWYVFSVADPATEHSVQYMYYTREYIALQFFFAKISKAATCHAVKATRGT